MTLTEALVEDALLRQLQGKAVTKDEVRQRYFGHVHDVALELVDRFRAEGSTHLYVEDVDREISEVADLVHNGDMPFRGGVKEVTIRLQSSLYTPTPTGH